MQLPAAITVACRLLASLFGNDNCFVSFCLLTCSRSHAGLLVAHLRLPRRPPLVLLRPGALPRPFGKRSPGKGCGRVQGEESYCISGTTIPSKPCSIWDLCHMLLTKRLGFNSTSAVSLQTGGFHLPAIRQPSISGPPISGSLVHASFGLKLLAENWLEEDISPLGP